MFVVLLVLFGAAATPTESLKDRDAEIRKALPPADHTLTSVEKVKLEGLLTESVDLPAMARAALGKRWEKLSEPDRKRFVKAFSARFKRASEGQIDFYRGTAITYDAEVPATNSAEGDVQVPTTLTLKGEPTPVVYTVRKEPAGFRIVDITIDGVSTVENYRSSFGKIFDKDGLDGLISRLNKDQAAKPKD